MSSPFSRNLEAAHVNVNVSRLREFNVATNVLCLAHKNDTELCCVSVYVECQSSAGVEARANGRKTAAAKRGNEKIGQ